AVGRFYGAFPHRQKRALEINYKILLGLNRSGLRRMVKHTFENFAVTLYDFFNPSNVVVDIPDRARLEALREKHGGLMVLTFHLGNWEQGARVMSQWGWPVTAVYQPYQNAHFKKLIESNRAPNVHFIPVGRRAAHGVRESLKRGDVVA